MANGVKRELLAFSVDTHIFRELGELLVGRDSTALAELIKNCYDADATDVSVMGIAMDRPQEGSIRIRDDGHGMTVETFKSGFLRVAGRQKEGGNRRSPKFQRRFTGEKGVGRLAAHKLAHTIEVISVPDSDIFGAKARPFKAVINWDAVEESQTLESLAASAKSGGGGSPQGGRARAEAITIEELSPGEIPTDIGRFGTVITLRRLRKRWTALERLKLHGEVQDLQFPEPLKEIPPILYPGPRLLKPKVQEAFIRDATSSNAFEIKFEGDLDTGDAFWQRVIDQKAWLLEIDGSSKSKPISVLITASARAVREYGEVGEHVAPLVNGNVVEPLQSTRLSIEWPEGECPTFVAKLLIRDGAATGVSANAKAFVSRAAGVRVYVEGFRILPYGEVGNDWLRLDYDYTQRSRVLDLGENGSTKVGDDGGLSAPPSRQVLGAVLMTQASSHPLRMLVNREGFVPDLAFDALVDSIKKSINLFVRFKAAQASASKERLAIAKKRPAGEQDSAASIGRVAQNIERKVAQASASANTAAESLRRGDSAKALAHIQDAARAVTSAVSSASGLVPEAAFMRVLASVGLQIGAFVHEVRAVHAGAVALRQDVDAHKEAGVDLPRPTRIFLSKLSRQISELTLSLEKQASDLSDVLSADARRRKSSQALLIRVEQALRTVAPAMERRSITVQTSIEPTLRTLPMYSSELVMIFSNLLTNAVKAAGTGGRIRISAKASDDWLVIRVQNTGVEVDLNESARWFRPFESTSSKVDPTLGIGMGMGLPITRSLVESYGGEIDFVKSTGSFATTVELRLPQKNG